MEKNNGEQIRKIKSRRIKTKYKELKGEKVNNKYKTECNEVNMKNKLKT